MSSSAFKGASAVCVSHHQMATVSEPAGLKDKNGNLLHFQEGATKREVERKLKERQDQQLTHVSHLSREKLEGLLLVAQLV